MDLILGMHAKTLVFEHALSDRSALRRMPRRQKKRKRKRKSDLFSSALMARGPARRSGTPNFRKSHSDVDARNAQRYTEQLDWGFAELHTLDHLESLETEQVLKNRTGDRRDWETN